MDAQEAIEATLEEYAEAYCSKDIDRLMALFDDGDEISLIGTGADELCAGRSAVESVFRRNFSEATARRFDWHWKHLIVANDCAVVALTLTIHLQIDNRSLEVPVRWTVTLLNRSGRWRWLHRHASSAAASQHPGAAYPES
ncbi:MAG: nuclear transport factor 2 family protein [Rhodovibrionaceae bacterium]|nr:nuclear transport factor 2 family protein [Rhodovibrionaceae bacterium]